MAGFLSKETIALEADRLGVSLEGLSWPEQQKAIAEARRAEKEKMAAEIEPKPEPEPKRESTVVDDAREREIAELKRELAAAKEQAKAVPQVPVVCELGLNVVDPTIEDYGRGVPLASTEAFEWILGRTMSFLLQNERHTTVRWHGPNSRLTW